MFGAMEAGGYVRVLEERLGMGVEWVDIVEGERDKKIPVFPQKTG